MNAMPELDISKILNNLYRRKVLILSVFVVVSVLAMYLSTILPVIYRSSTLILVQPQRLPASFVTSTVTTDLSQRMQTIAQEIFSRTRLEKIVQEFGLYPSSDKGMTMEDRVVKLRGAIKIEFRGNNAFQLSFDHESPEKAKEVTSRLASLYIEENLQVREQQAMGTKSFITDESERLRKELEEQEAEVTRYKSSNRFELPDQLDANLRTIDQLRAELQGSLSRLASLQQRKADMEKQLVEAEVSGPESVGPKGGERGALSTADVLIQTKRRELDDLLRRYRAKHPDVIRLKNEIAAAEAELKSQKGQLGNSIAAGPALAPVVSPLAQVLQKQVAALDAEIKVLQPQIDNLRHNIAVYQLRVDNTPLRGIELSKISRTYDITLQKYRDLLAKGLESQLSENMEKKQKGEQFQIVDPANFPLRPLTNRSRIILLGLLGGLAAGIGLAFLWDMLDTSFKRGDELAGYVNIPLLATIPELMTRGTVLDERRAQGIIVLASIGVLVVGLFCVRQFGPMYF